MAPKIAHERFSRSESETLLIDSLISLVGDHHISEITVDLIASHAGLKSGHVLVHRYFGARSDLVAVAAHHIATRMINDLSTSREAFNEPTGQQVMITIGGQIDKIRRRSILIAELMTTGADSFVHAQDTREICDELSLYYQLIGLSVRISHAIAIQTLTLTISQMTQQEWMGTSDAEIEDVRNLALLEIVNAESISQQLGWS